MCPASLVIKKMQIETLIIDQRISTRVDQWEDEKHQNRWWCVPQSAFWSLSHENTLESKTRILFRLTVHAHQFRGRSNIVDQCWSTTADRKQRERKGPRPRMHLSTQCSQQCSPLLPGATSYQCTQLPTHWWVNLLVSTAPPYLTIFWNLHLWTHETSSGHFKSKPQNYDSVDCKWPAIYWLLWPANIGK